MGIKLTTEKKKPMGKWTKRLLILAVSLWGVFIALMILVSMADEPAEDKAEVKQEVGVDDKLNWQQYIAKMSSNEELNGGKTGVYDEVMRHAKSADFSESKIKEFEKAIIADYQSKKYLTNDDQTKLENMFRAAVVERHYDDKEQKAIDAFAFDYLQNLKYVYRGVDKPDSEAVKANEAQMDKALAALK